MPQRLSGTWKVSLCIGSGHSWTRFEETTSGEIHTFGRFHAGNGGSFDWRKLRKTWPNSKVSGVHMDMELRLEKHIKGGKFLLLSVFVKDPPIYRGRRHGCGHGLSRTNA
ncbi:MAG: hypothetical protein ACE5KM_10625 [Planctomycetaceae bacterium]